MGVFFFFQAEDGIRDLIVTGVQTCALPISRAPGGRAVGRAADTGGAAGAAAPVPRLAERDRRGRSHGAGHPAGPRARPPALLAGAAAARPGRGGRRARVARPGQAAFVWRPARNTTQTNIAATMTVGQRVQTPHTLYRRPTPEHGAGRVAGR